ncbi:hypothetical protein [Mesorhizobium sp. WSM4906]|uniref:DUF6931 family protein n=1 Tax=Mesorhizobium sp. WSM4906 TaxID=3038546 RepID=UPI0024177ABC|nr:hypothetical protein [Mesorhizobium sp. WSM4906]WFP79478.1 hypothetical protein QAZ22_29905 [Mesorhizobium sp. WSM4906]
MARGLRFRTARDLFSACPAVAQDMKAPPTDQPSIEFCRTLLAGRVPEEAITFCAYLLPERAAVWWAHECLSNLAELLGDRDLELLAVVRDWVGEPGNPNHRTAVAQAVEVPPVTPVSWLALAAGWRDSGSVIDQAAGGFPTAHAVSAGILAGLARVSLADRLAVLSAFVEMGIQMAEMEAQQQSADVY